MVCTSDDATKYVVPLAKRVRVYRLAWGTCLHGKRGGAKEGCINKIYDITEEAMVLPCMHMHAL